MQVQEPACQAIQTLISDLGRQARMAAAVLRSAPGEEKNRVLLRMADLFDGRRERIQAENAKDLEAAEQRGLSAAMIDRLRLTPKRLDAMSEALRQVARLDDPVGEIFDTRVRPNGLTVARMRVPIGVIAIIYESRPNVTADAAALCLKSGNAVILRGGSEALHSNMCLAALMQEALAGSAIPPQAVQVVPVTDRQAVTALLRLNEFVDLIIPRGGRSLIETVVNTSTIPVIKHYDGNCFIYVDEFANLDEALRIVVNAKCQRPGVCNALESLLVHKAVARPFFARLVPLLRDKGVELRADETVHAWHPGDTVPAAPEDWDTEYLDLILTVGVVDGVDEAIERINTHGSHHTDAILTDSHTRAMRFVADVDSACVHVNCSTRFSDGGEYGMGCEIGISTDKLHARGPMGLKELTTAKFVVFGNGQIRE
ncbi:MAG: glutamate-5-semialdehyde dehydrogenase [Candidatus Sumerlaeia bacterium]